MTTELQHSSYTEGTASFYGPLLRIAVGTLLLVAAGLKSHELITAPVSGTGLLDMYTIRIAMIELELILGGWLVSGVRQDISRRAAACAMATFAAVTLYKATSGAASCGCFGVVPVSPWFTFVLDVAIVAGLLRWRPPVHSVEDGEQSPRLMTQAQTVVMAVIAVVGLLFAGAAMMNSPTRQMPVANASNDQRQLVILEPEAWVGRQLPIAEHIEGPDLRSGAWLVVFYHNGCGSCQTIVPEIQLIASEWKRAGATHMIAFINVPEEHSSAQQLVANGDSFEVGRLSEKHEWFMTAPAVLVIDEGRVRRVYPHDAVDSAEAVRRTLSELDDASKDRANGISTEG